MQVVCGKQETSHGFTLIELLVVIGIIALLSTLGMAATRGVMVKAKQAKCASNLRQLGAAIIAYTQENHGSFPVTSHGLDAATMQHAWIYTLAEHLADVDEVRICPADPNGSERLKAGGTSYILNSYLTVPKVNPFGESTGGYTNLSSITSAVNTPIAFIINFSKGVGVSNDHTHSESWKSWASVTKDIQPDAFRFASAAADHSTGSSNYLFVDGHVESIPAATIRDQVSSGHNFANPESHASAH